MSKLYDVYFKPAMSGVICVEAESKEDAIRVVQENEDLMSSEEILERISNAMEFDGYDLEIIDCLEC